MTRRDFETRYKQIGEKALDKRATGVKLPVEIGDAVRSLPSSARSIWLRQVITVAAKKDLLESSDDMLDNPG